MIKNLSLKKIKNLFNDASQLILESNSIPLVYFNEVKNVGDLISPYLVEKISRRKTYPVCTGVFPRLIGVGSILGSATQNSHVWGTGLMSPNHRPNKVNNSLIHAVRGKKTRDYLFKNYNLTKDLPLGDPAILMPNFYNPGTSIKSDIGFIPHYVDYERVTQLAAAVDPLIRVIDVRQEPERFIDELLCCSHVISTSLHGLILSDAYRIPNAWASLSNNIEGGDWKYLDYYSTTAPNYRQKFFLQSCTDIELLISDVDRYFQVSELTTSQSDLVSSFPCKYLYDN